MANTQAADAGKRRSKNDDLKFRNGRWHWAVYKTQDGHVFRNSKGEPTGNVFRRDGSRADKTQAGADRDEAVREYHRQLDRAALATPGKHTLKTWAEKCLEDIWPGEVGAGDMKQTTLDAYAYPIANHIVPRIGAERLSQLTRGSIKTWLQKVKAAHGENVARNALTVLRSMLLRALDAEEIQTYPADRITVTTTRQAGRKVEGEEPGKMILDPEQRKRLLDKSVGTCVEMPTYLGLLFGLRSGEADGLRWDDVDIEKAEIRVSQQAQYHRGEKGVQITTTKSQHSDRSLPIPSACLDYLRAKKATAQGSSSFVVRTFACTRNGELIGAKKHSKYFKVVAEAAGFRPVEDGGEGVPTSHDLRTTFLSDLASKGVLLHVLKDLAGHASVATTEKYYVRPGGDQLKEAMELVG